METQVKNIPQPDNKSDRDFRDLVAWKKCRDVRNDIWNLCKPFPKDEQYRLTDQLIRASRSSTANIAEGYGRFHYQENIQFCRQSRGSLFELIDHLDTARTCGYINSATAENMTRQVGEAIKIVNGYIKYLRKCKKTENRNQ